jgi:DNA polymerase V
MSDTFATPGRRFSTLTNLPEKLKITGFSSPAADYECLQPSLDEIVGIGAPHIFLWRLKSEALAGLSLHTNDTLVVNRQTELAHGRIAVIVIEGEHRVCLAQKEGGSMALVGVDRNGVVLRLERCEEVEVWGVVDFVVRDVRDIRL